MTIRYDAGATATEGAAFAKTLDWLDRQGIPTLQTNRTARVVTTDFGKAIREKKVTFRDGDIYLEHEGHLLRGYAFMYSYDHERFRCGPKLHFRECKTVKEFRSRNQFNQKYIWSNSAHNTWRDRSTGHVFEADVLDVCGNCLREADEDFADSREFYHEVVAPQLQSLDLAAAQSRVVNVNADGYTEDWEQISQQVRIASHYTCDECGVRIGSGAQRRFLHVHHRNGNKADNSPGNLRPLCLICHGHVDENHRARLLEGPVRRREIGIFVRGCRNRLADSANGYWRAYDEGVPRRF